METRQFYGYKIETAPVNLPLTLEEVEEHLRISVDSEDDYLTFLIETVRDYFECYTNRTLINTTYKAYLDDFPSSIYYYDCCDGILIRKSKVSSISSIKYLSDNVLTTWDSSNYYFTDVNSYPKVYLVNGSTYPTVDVRKQAIEIIFIAGYGATETSIPSDIKMALLNHIALLYENRGDCVADGTCELSCISKSVYNKYRIHPIGWGGC
jgi:uncharacterized phiE125 gp8 family phage protein